MKGMNRTPGFVNDNEPSLAAKTEQHQLVRLEDDFATYRADGNTGSFKINPKDVAKFTAQINALREIVKTSLTLKGRKLNIFKTLSYGTVIDYGTNMTRRYQKTTLDLVTDGLGWLAVAVFIGWVLINLWTM